MKKLILLLALAATFSTAYGQIKFQKNYHEALTLAARQQKPVFVMVMPPLNGVPGTKNTYSAFKTKNVAGFYNANFINYQLSLTDTFYHYIAKNFHPVGFPAYIFLDKQGGLIYKTFGNGEDEEQCLQMANTALDRMNSGKTIGTYKLLTENNTITGQQLREYITMRMDNGLYNNAQLIDKYVQFLPVRALYDYNEVLFVMKAGPLLNSDAYKLSNLNQKLIDSIYKTEPWDLRVSINDRIFDNTMAESINIKNSGLAYQAAYFRQNSWVNDVANGNKSFAQTMLTYYKGVKDTASYFQHAGYFNDQYYMSVNVDEARKKVAENNAQMQADIEESQKLITKEDRKKAKKNGGVITTSRIMTGRSMPDYTPGGITAATLNNAAYEFYTLDTRNPTHLYKALTWVKRAIDIAPLPTFYDTQAHVFYRLGLYDEALLNQNKAITLGAAQSLPKDQLEGFKTELSKMKQRTL